MPEISKIDKNNADFNTMIPEYNDSEIINILIQRKHYQPGAVDLAIKEAIKRGLINSEQDLFSEEYQVKPLKYSLFPTIESEKNKAKTRKSISRGLILIGLLPVVWGFVKINNEFLIEGGILLLLGIVWILLASKLNRSGNNKIVIFLFVVLLLSSVYIVKILIGLKAPTTMDIFVPVVLYLLVAYGLLFIRRLHS